MINHACRPNAVQMFEHASIYIRAVTPIREGACQCSPNWQRVPHPASLSYYV